MLFAACVIALRRAAARIAACQGGRKLTKRGENSMRTPTRAALEPRLTLIASAVAVCLTGVTNRSIAQDAQAQQGLDEITVTGSRISRRDYTAPSPILTVDVRQFERLSTVGVETALNQLPQFQP